MSQLPGRPDPDLIREAGQAVTVLTAEARELIDGQFADRPHLRPVLDAVLAALPAIGPVTVQARTTLVSLVTPRRTFAVVRATAKNRVDLDEEALGWLRRAYEENTAPPPPRRPARRPAPVAGQLTVVIEGFDLPGLTCGPEPGGPVHHNIHVALGGPGKDRRGPAEPGGDRPALVMPGRPGLAFEPVPGDAPSARWEVTVTVRRDQDGFDFSGPFVRGDRTDRHLGLAWATSPATERCRCSAAPSSGSPTSIPGSSRRRCAPTGGSSPGSG